MAARGGDHEVAGTAQIAVELGRPLVARLGQVSGWWRWTRGGRSQPRGEEPKRRRKLRPIACSEPLLQFAKTLVLSSRRRETDVLKKLEPRQLGCGTPDAAQLLFATSREEAADNTHVVASRDITRVGLQDGLCAVTGLEEPMIELQACLHRLRIHKCKVWFPGWDDYPR